ncbi:Transforming growth factor-beta-induced protein ig-h3, partial [Stegodyphus mimosarum]
MRFVSLATICSAVLVGLIAQGCAQISNSRQKRFLSQDFWNPLSDSLLGLGDYARDLTDQITAQASVAMQHMIPQATRAVGGLAPRGRVRLEDTAEPPKKRGLIRVPVGRETEGDEKEVEVFDPVQVEKPQKPSHPGGGIIPFIPFSFSFGLLTPWWDGPNVCVERNEVEEPEEDTKDIPGFSINFQTTRCVPSESSHTCIKTTQTNGMRKTVIIRRQCCHGYIRRTDGRPGCSALKMENLIDTMKSLEMNKFLNWVENAGLKESLLTENYTVFAPSNDAIVDFEDDSEDNEISAINPAKRLIDVSSIVAGHILEGFTNVDNLENEELLNTLNEASKIRINKYQPAHEVVTANCIPVIGKNNFATNGIVHLASGVLPQPKQTVGELIENDSQFNTFKRLLLESNFMEDLKKSEQPWTLFVPTDEAFGKLPRSLQKQIDSKEGCVESILNQHIVKGTICTPAVVSQVRIKNILDNSLQLTRDESEKLRVDGALIDVENTMGTNGVIHVIDKVLIPPQARSLLKALEEEERRDLLDLIELADLISTLEEMQNVTFFVPSEEALKSLSNDTLQELVANPELLRKLLQHHLVQPRTSGSMFADNKKLETMNGHDIHITLHEVFPGIITGATVQCAYVVSHDNHACGAVIHKINKVLMPPKGSIIETLKDMEGHNIVVKLLQNTELETKLQEDGPFTFLAPNDEAFERLSDSLLEDLLENKTKAEQILKLHVLPELLCCNQVSHASPFHRQYVRTYDGSILPLHRGLGDRVRFGRARAIQCDTAATNGLVHSINKVILPQRPTTHIFASRFHG